MSSSCFIPFAAFFQGDTFGKLSGEFSGNSCLGDSAVPGDMGAREAFCQTKVLVTPKTNEI